MFFFSYSYREDRKWWEVVVTFRKVGIVAIATFGTMMGAVDLQAFVALAVVFIAIVLHLFGKPFDTTERNTRLLHHLEFGALTVCWFTFWGRSNLCIFCERYEHALTFSFSLLLLYQTTCFELLTISNIERRTNFLFRQQRYSQRHNYSSNDWCFIKCKLHIFIYSYCYIWSRIPERS